MKVNTFIVLTELLTYPLPVTKCSAESADTIYRHCVFPAVCQYIMLHQCTYVIVDTLTGQHVSLTSHFTVCTCIQHGKGDLRADTHPRSPGRVT